MLQLSVGGGWEGREVGIGATNYGVCFFFNERGKSFVCSFSSSHTFVPNRRRLLSFSVDLYAIGEREDWEKGERGKPHYNIRGNLCTTKW